MPDPGQTILVAGATGSTGGAAAVALAKRGARVVLLGRRAEKLRSRADSIRNALTEAGVEHEVTDVATLVIDFSDLASVRAAAEEALNRFAEIDVAFDPTSVLDKSDPELKDRWPAGFAGLVWRLMAAFRAKPPEVAGEPISELMLSHPDRSSLNVDPGALQAPG